MRVERLGVVGAGTMGSGIAQLSCLAGFETTLHDADPGALAAGTERIEAALEKGARGGLWDAVHALAAAGLLQAAAELDELAASQLVIEAAPEQLDLKRELFAGLERICGPEAVLATNTSSLLVGEIAAGLERPERVCGMHFFNPPVRMRLVEVIAADRSAEDTLETAASVAHAMGRVAVRAADSPGFIVNRCNRPFALEALRMLGEGVAGHAELDLVVRERGGYPMGPFELVDLVGIDVSLAVARSFYSQRRVARWEPHPIQERMVAEGRLGRKSGRGFYEYEDGRKVEPEGVAEPAAAEEILERIVATLVNEASLAVEEGVAVEKDVDRAMRLGLNHPCGPFEWRARLGPAPIVAVLEGLAESLEQPERYAVARSLRELAG